ncbi:Retrovirus-related Pol polyprotein from transposon gypsy [Eumeta japonica]|uniref:RNA-directed DNA polymerase n=1 Tax=Eumeta variegata TaxID=151549 RepID=A0A4C1SM74_EUMVA|nr:Retrovirus-related Pol polyprotein from transposon gypsy [Eumeta japonica]
MENAVRIFKNGLNNESIRQTLHGNPIRDLEHAYAVAQTMEHNVRCTRVNNDQQQDRMQRRQPQPNQVQRHNHQHFRRPLYNPINQQQNNWQQANNRQQSNNWHQQNNWQQADNRQRSNWHQQSPEPMDTTSANVKQPQQGFHSQPWKRLQERSGNFIHPRKIQKHNRMEAANQEDEEDDKCSSTNNNRDRTFEKRIDELMKINNKIGPLPFTSTIEASIRTTTNDPIWAKQYPGNMNDMEFVNNEIEKLLKDGIIRKSYSPYNSPMLTVHKKGTDENGNPKRRMVIDFRKLNDHTITDRYIIPDVNITLQNLGGANFFTTLDLESGFHQIKIKESDREKTAFCVNGGKYEFVRMPFGLKNAPSIFQRCVDDILRDYIGKFVYVYIDDVLIYSSSPEEHMKHIEIVFEALNKATLKISNEKSKFFMSEVEYLGHIIKHNRISTDPKKIRAIEKFPTPKTLKDLRGFLGLTGYYRRFVKNYAQVAKPLTIYLKGENAHVGKNKSANKEIKLDQSAITAVNELKLKLKEQVELYQPDFKKPFELTTDASNIAIGAVLSQNKNPIYFLSRTLSETERRYDRKPTREPLGTSLIPTKPREFIHMDIYYNDKLMYLVAIDKFSKYITARKIATKIDLDNEAEEILTNNYPECKRLLTDNEASFVTPSFKQMCIKHGVEKVETPVYRSKANGQVERAHNTIGELARIFKIKNSSSTKDEISRSIKELNNSIHSVTGYRPADIYFGRIPFDTDKISKKLQQASTNVLERLNKGTKHREFKEGTQIFVKTTTRSKSSPKYRKEIVKEDRGETVLTRRGAIVHKDNIKNSTVSQNDKIIPNISTAGNIMQDSQSISTN